MTRGGARALSVVRHLGLAACMASVLSAAGPASAPPADKGPWLRERLASARPGEIIDVPPGEYGGPFTIDRPLTLRGSGRATLRGDGKTHVVAVRAADVTIEGFEIRGSGLDLSLDQAAIHISSPRAVIRGNRITDSLHGVYVRKADNVRIEGNTILGKTTTLELVDPFAQTAAPGGGEVCEVQLGQNRRGNGIHIWNSAGHLIIHNVIRDTRDGIYFSFVDNSDVRDNDISHVRYGLHYMYSDENRFERNVFRENAAGAALMFSKGIVLRGNRFEASQTQRSYGLLMQGVDDTQVVDNRIAGNTMGLFVENSHDNRITDNRVVSNNIGVHVSDSSGGNVFTGNTFAGNLHPVETSGNNLSNEWASAGRGNYWDDALRLDLNGDGIGDLPHRELDLFGQLRRPFPAIGLLAGSPGERLLRFVHSRIALPGLPGISDPAPLVRPAEQR